MPGLVKYWWFIRPKTINHSRSGRESNSRPLSRKSDSQTRIQSQYSTRNIVVHSSQKCVKKRQTQFMSVCVINAHTSVMSALMMTVEQYFEAKR